MAGNSSRRGAIRNPGSKKGMRVGSGGQGRQALEGRGPTPPAAARTGHPAARRAAAAARREQTAGGGRGGPGAGRGGAGGPRRPSTSRASAGVEAVAGRNSVVEALRASVPATALHVATRIDTDDRVREALRTATERGLPVLETTRGDLDRMSDGAVHQGLVLQVPPYEHVSLADVLERAADAGSAPLVVALDGVTDPRNLGAVVRSTAAFGGHGVLVPERRSAGMTAAAWKASAGAAARVPVARETNLTRALEAAKTAGCFVVGLDAEADAAIDAPEVARVADGGLVLVVGSEGKGLSRLVRATCDLVASIPMAGAVESLNAGVAAGVALYAVSRARTGARPPA